MKIEFILEWENAEGFDEALMFLDGLGQRLEEYRKKHTDIEHALTVVFEGNPDIETTTQIGAICEKFFAKSNITFLSTDDVPYYAKKMVAALKSDASIVVFCDSDCIYSDVWPQALIEPIQNNRAAVTCGRTLALLGDSWIERTSALAWFFPLKGVGDPLEKAKPSFKANNFAAARDVFVTCPIPRHHGSRSHSGYWLRLLAEHQLTVEFIPESEALHQQFEGIPPFFARAWLLGRDSNISKHMTKYGIRTRRILLKRAWSSMRDRFRRFSTRAKSPAMHAIARSRAEKFMIFTVGWLFQAVTSLSHFYYAVFDRKPVVSFEYEDTLLRTQKLDV